MLPDIHRRAGGGIIPEPPRRQVAVEHLLLTRAGATAGCDTETGLVIAAVPAARFYGDPLLVFAGRAELKSGWRGRGWCARSASSRRRRHRHPDAQVRVPLRASEVAPAGDLRLVSRMPVEALEIRSIHLSMRCSPLRAVSSSGLPVVAQSLAATRTIDGPGIAAIHHPPMRRLPGIPQRPGQWNAGTGSRQAASARHF
jgi:hypothetical protein